MSNALHFSLSVKATAPFRATKYSAGLDIASPEDYMISPEETIKIPYWFEIQITRKYIWTNL